MAYRRVGEWLARQRRWAEAADRYYALMEIDKLEPWQVVTLDYQACGVLLAECGDRERYDRFCKAAIERFKSGTDGDEAGRVLKTCLLFPCGPDVMEALAPMARAANERYRPAPMNWPVIYLALWEYRRGDFAAVDRWCRGVISQTGESEVVTSTLRVIQAMADQKRGRAVEATEQLAFAQSTVERYFEHDQLPAFQQGYWYDWLFARILLREAVAMVQGEARGGPKRPSPPDAEVTARIPRIPWRSSSLLGAFNLEVTVSSDLLLSAKTGNRYEKHYVKTVCGRVVRFCFLCGTGDARAGRRRRRAAKPGAEGL